MSVNKVNQSQVQTKSTYGDIVATATDWSNQEGITISVSTAKDGMQMMELTHCEWDALMLAVQQLKVGQGNG